jgi:hypothetical protein
MKTRHSVLTRYYKAVVAELTSMTHPDHLIHFAAAGAGATGDSYDSNDSWAIELGKITIREPNEPEFATVGALVYLDGDIVWQISYLDETGDGIYDDAFPLEINQVDVSPYPQPEVLAQAIYDAVEDRFTKVSLYTDAPRAYDGFSATTVAIMGIGRRDDPVRHVRILPKDLAWQTARYDSGMNAWTLVGPDEAVPAAKKGRPGYNMTFDQYREFGDWKPLKLPEPTPDREPAPGIEATGKKKKRARR